MLILSRKVNQSILINGGEIKIKVVRIERNEVKLGIEAPEDVSIHREEVQAKIKQDE